MGLSLGLRGPDLGPQHRLGGWGQVKVRQEIDGAQAEQLSSILSFIEDTPIAGARKN